MTNRNSPFKGFPYTSNQQTENEVTASANNCSSLTTRLLLLSLDAPGFEGSENQKSSKLALYEEKQSGEEIRRHPKTGLLEVVRAAGNKGSTGFSKELIEPVRFVWAVKRSSFRQMAMASKRWNTTEKRLEEPYRLETMNAKRLTKNIKLCKNNLVNHLCHYHSVHLQAYVTCQH